MRDNSGSGKSKHNNRDPTLKEHIGQGGTGREGQDFTGGPDFDIARNAGVRGQKASPSSRRRGETAVTERAPATDKERSR